MRFRVSAGAQRSAARPFPRPFPRPGSALARANTAKSFNWFGLLCQQNGLSCSIIGDSSLLVMGEPEKIQLYLHITGSSLAHCAEDQRFFLIRSLC